MHVALFATCLVDSFRPSVGFSAVALLESAGCTVDVPVAQTCCGQPAYNNGDSANARKIAQQLIDTFSPYEYVVIPSASCAGMIQQHFPRLFEHDPLWLQRSREFAGRCYELVIFLHDILRVSSFPVQYQGTVTYHDSCSSLREVSVKHKVRDLLAGVEKLQLNECSDTEVCCGFGGTFCVKYPEIATSMVDDKVTAITASGADMLSAGDLGCLLHLAGRLKRLNHAIQIYHVAELLAGHTDIPGIGDGQHDPVANSDDAV